MCVTSIRLFVNKSTTIWIQSRDCCFARRTPLRHRTWLACEGTLVHGTQRFVPMEDTNARVMWGFQLGMLWCCWWSGKYLLLFYSSMLKSGAVGRVYDEKRIVDITIDNNANDTSRSNNNYYNYYFNYQYLLTHCSQRRFFFVNSFYLAPATTILKALPWFPRIVHLALLLLLRALSISLPRHFASFIIPPLFLSWPVPHTPQPSPAPSWGSKPRSENLSIPLGICAKISLHLL